MKKIFLLLIYFVVQITIDVPMAHALRDGGYWIDQLICDYHGMHLVIFPDGSTTCSEGEYYSD